MKNSTQQPLNGIGLAQLIRVGHSIRLKWVKFFNKVKWTGRTIYMYSSINFVGYGVAVCTTTDIVHPLTALMLNSFQFFATLY